MSKKPVAITGDAIAGIFALSVAAVAFLVWAAASLAGLNTRSNNPFAVLMDILTGHTSWTTTAWVIVVSLLLAALGLLITIIWIASRWRGKKKRGDQASRHLSNRDDLYPLSPKGVAASAAKLRPGLISKNPDEHGIFIGESIRPKMALRQSWEDMSVDIWGPRKGKTVARAIPAVVCAPGPVIATARKGDIVDATRGPRSLVGNIWAFDPMGMLGQRQAFWWNPLRGITTISQARRLAEAFTFNGESSKADAYFGPKADDLVANFILAAAVGGKTMVEVYVWSTRPRDDTPASLLENAGLHVPAKSVRGTIALPEKTRGGVYGGAEKSLSVLTEQATVDWITPQAGLPEFLPEDFVTSTDTLYLLSKDSPGAPAPVVAAFVDTVFNAAEEAAWRQPKRRLNPALVAVLDEAANIVKIKNLPNLYSYYGSTGIIIMTILQSFTQGVGVWGREGMQAMWSAANIRVLGGGLADGDFIEQQSKLIGEYDQPVQSVSAGSTPNSRSVSTSMQRRRIFESSDIASLPNGRMIVLPSGAPAVLAKARFWWDTPWAHQVEESLAHWDPDQTSDEARQAPPINEDEAGDFDARYATSQRPSAVHHD